MFCATEMHFSLQEPSDKKAQLDYISKNSNSNWQNMRRGVEVKVLCNALIVLYNASRSFVWLKTFRFHVQNIQLRLQYAHIVEERSRRSDIKTLLRLNDGFCQ